MELKEKDLIFLLIGIFLCNHRNMSFDHESVIFLFASAPHLDPNVCSINLMSLFQNVGKNNIVVKNIVENHLMIENNKYYVIVIICCYLNPIYYIALLHKTLSTLMQQYSTR